MGRILIPSYFTFSIHFNAEAMPVYVQARLIRRARARERVEHHGARVRRHRNPPLVNFQGF